jgi:hypothetical protein
MQSLEINGWKFNMIDRDPEGARLRPKHTEKCCSSETEERFYFT